MIRLQWHRIGRSSKKTSLFFFICSHISRHRELFFQNCSLGLFPLIAASIMFAKPFEWNLWERLYHDGENLEWSRYKTEQSWCSAVFCRKRIAFEMQCYLIVVSLTFKTCLKRSWGSYYYKKPGTKTDGFVSGIHWDVLVSVFVDWNW